MKHLLCILSGVLLTVTASAQEHYQFLPGTEIYDLPGDHFLTHRIANNKVYLEHRDVSGATIWSDSLDNAPHPLAFQLGRFGETGNYRVFIQDSVVTWHATFSLSTHQFGDFRSDTLSTWYRRTTCSLTDTSLYVFSGDYAGIGVLDHTVWTITESGTTTVLPFTLQSSPATDFQFVPQGGGILELFNNYGWMHSRHFDTELQQTSPVYNDSTTAGYGFPELIYSRVKSEDSIFAFFYNYDLFSVPERQAWMMAWLTPEMDTLAVYENSFNPNVYPYYTLNFDDVVLTDDYIYVYAYKYSGTPAPSPRQLVVFDHDFDTVCSYLTSHVGEAHLTLLNDEAYTIWQNPGGVELFHVGACGFAGLDESAKVEVCIYPNPASGAVAVDLVPGTVSSVELWDTDGALLLQQAVEQSADTLAIDLSVFANGVYLVKAIGASGHTTVRVVVNR